VLTAVAECANANVLSDWLMTIGYRGGPITHSEMEIINSVTEVFPMVGRTRSNPTGCYLMQASVIHVGHMHIY
jgi:hypothetical protein